MIPIQVPLLNGQTRTEWTSGKDINKVFYEDLSRADQYLLNDIYHSSNLNIDWEDYITKYDKKVNVKYWALYFFLGTMK
tara:strand:- start:342 stop:578 length:237 start_codon:yes stop_codon:yes gene_type:complete